MKNLVYTLLIGVLAMAGVATANAQVPSSPAQMKMTFAPLVSKAKPSVVNIYTKRVVQQRTRLINPFFNDPFFNQFFNNQAFEGPVQKRIENSLGSGVIVDAKGLIATNNHVINEADKIMVVTSDGHEFDAEKVLADSRVDLAILKIDPKGEKIQPINFSDSDQIQVGDIVLAIGNPFGVGQTVTSGIVSGLARTNVTQADYSSFIQTDAAINPGNSGGALIDVDGNLIGINTAIYSKDGGSLGIGFAIPANMVKAVVSAAQNGGKLVHPWTGVTSQDVTPDLVESLKLPKASGTLVSEVQKGGPADKAGIKVGDVVLAVNDVEVTGAQSLKFRLATFPIGTTVKLGVWRKGRALDLKLTTMEQPENPPRETTLVKGVNPLSGAVIMNISPAVIEDMGKLGQDHGVVVSEIKEGDAGQLGIQSGDIILTVNNVKTETVSDVLKSVKNNTRRWQLQIMRGGQTLTLTIAR